MNRCSWQQGDVEDLMPLFMLETINKLPSWILLIVFLRLEKTQGVQTEGGF